MAKTSANSTRRRLLAAATAIGGLALLAPFDLARAALALTPGQPTGPFYPLALPLDHDNDLAAVTGRAGRPVGKLLHLVGRVLDAGGQPIDGARVEIWQANSFGRYDHPRDANDAPLDPNFQGYGETMTDALGAYRFRTIEPGAYPVSGTWMRPPHIHVAVGGAGFERFVTQMYFPGQPLNALDPLLQSAGEARTRLIATLHPPPPELEPDSLVAEFDIVLGAG